MTIDLFEDLQSPVRRFISETLRIADLDDQRDIFASGLANSLFAMQLVAFIEVAFAISIEEDDLELENFASVTAICRFVAGKRGR